MAGNSGGRGRAYPSETSPLNQVVSLASLQATRWYTTLKVVQIVAAAAVPVLVATSGESFAFKSLIAALGGLVVILEGVQQLKQYSWNA